jgi:hypothetical protein
MKPRVMFDTGALIALERGQQSMRKVHRLAFEQGYQVVATTLSLPSGGAEEKREKERMKIIRTAMLEPPDGYVARLAVSKGFLRFFPVSTSNACKAQPPRIDIGGRAASPGDESGMSRPEESGSKCVETIAVVLTHDLAGVHIEKHREASPHRIAGGQ